MGHSSSPGSPRGSANSAALPASARRAACALLPGSPRSATLPMLVQSSGRTRGVVVPDKADDMQLVERIAAGDAEALGELYDRYGRLIFGVLYRMLPAPQAAEEVAQDAFHAVWRQAGSYRRDRGPVCHRPLRPSAKGGADSRRAPAPRAPRAGGHTT